jgi:hypothetical protein
MFRNIYSDDICVYKTNIRDAIENSKKLLPNLIEKYSNKNLIDKVNKIIDISNKQIIIFDYKVSAYYYTENYVETANVTNKLIILFNNYKNNNQDTFIVSNDIFTDTCINVVKTLFINIEIDDEIFKINFGENEKVSWNDILNKINKYLDTKKEKYLIETSIGEIIDKYSILELKRKYISDVNKLQDIDNEMKTLENYVLDIKTSHFYKMLLYINEQIWLDTDIIKELNVNNINNINKDLETICKIYDQIFDNNQKRFRLKNHFNTVKKSYIKEHKSYSKTSCFIDVLDEIDIYSKIPEINYLCISYDIIYFNNDYKHIINKLFINTNIKFIENNVNLDPDPESEHKLSLKKYDLQTFTINADIKNIFDFEPIKYKSGGKLGDFLNQLSVICEKFYETGRKGELYIFEGDDKFTFSLENTYKDTYDTIITQKFIKGYQIYNNEPIDINLNSWRLNLLSKYIPKNNNWFDIYSTEFDISWGKNKWLSSPIDPTWNNKIIINITPYRFMSPNAINQLKEKLNDFMPNCIFVANEKEHYDYFTEKTKINIEYYKPQNFTEIVTIINSCKVAFLGFSSASVIANALHKENYIIGTNGTDYMLNNLKGNKSFILDIFV